LEESNIQTRQRLIGHWVGKPFSAANHKDSYQTRQRLIGCWVGKPFSAANHKASHLQAIS